MKNNVFLVCMLLFSISVFGQELKIQGHLIDEEKQDLVAATIRCYLNDTLFVVGGTQTSTYGTKVQAINQLFRL